MSYTKERDEFIATISAEGMRLDVARKLLRYASTLQRLAVAQCNGDYPYNGDRDRPSAESITCGPCNGTGKTQHVGLGCVSCKGAGRLWFRNVDADKRHDRHYVTCPKCEASGVAKSAVKRGMCPDCRTTELVKAAMPEGFKAVLNGDPRGCVFKVRVPSGKTNDGGREGICVPSREC